MTPTQIADRYWEAHLREFHFYNLYLGELRHLEKWDDVSPEGTERVAAEFEQIRDEAREAAVLADGAERDLAETVAAAAEMNAAELTWSAELLLPNLQSGLVSFLLPGIHMQPLRSAEDGDRYLQKLCNFATFIDQAVSRLEAGAGSGLVPTDFNTAATVARIEQLVTSGDLAARLTSQPAPSENPASDWADRLAATVGQYFVPAMDAYADALRTTTLPAARPVERPGLCHLAGGDEVYARLAGAYTSLDLDPESIHQVGLEQVARLEDEYRQIAGPLLGTSDLDQIYLKLRTGEGFHHTSADSVVADAMRCLAKAKAAMGDWFGTLPVTDCVGSPIDVGAMAYYRSPSDDLSVPGQFFFNTADPSAWAKFQVAAIAYHEAIPGHHLDTALAMENRALHDVHRKVYLPAFGEGWALYTERLAEEMGLYEDDWERIGMLMGDSLRACRLVVDTGLHALGWSRDKAIEYVLAHSPMALHEITEEIDRYIGNPGQALAYMLGRLEIDDMRATAERELGERFDIKGFHGAILGSGTLPLETLRRRVKTWAAGLAA